MKPYNQHIILHDSVCGDSDPLLMYVYMFGYIYIYNIAFFVWQSPCIVAL